MNATNVYKQIADFSAYGMMASGIGVWIFICATGLTAGYGRHYQQGNKKNLGDLGPKMSFKYGWIIQEAGSLGASVLTVLVFMWYGADFPKIGELTAWEHFLKFKGWIYLIPYWCHYVHRQIIYPLMTHSDNPLSLAIMASAFCFSSWNGIQQTISVVGYCEQPPNYYGLIVFVIGAAGNLWHDYELIGLRKQHGQYVVPQRGMFRWISCPNYLCEFVEWFGFAIFAHFSKASLAFLLFTIANLWPRAGAHHRWYQNRFPDFPRNRRVIIPFIY